MCSTQRCLRLGGWAGGGERYTAFVRDHFDAFDDGGLGGAGLRVLTAAELAEVDRVATTELAMPALLLMEHAAMGLSAACLRMLSVLMVSGGEDDDDAEDAEDGGGVGDGSVVVVCGGGNNGGDGLAVARLLDDAGVEVAVLMTVGPDRLRGPAAVNHAMAAARGLAVEVMPGGLDGAGAEAWVLGELAARGPALVVDAMIGTGLDRPVAGAALGVIRAVNAWGAGGGSVVAADVPSGLSADRGVAMPEAVRADVTVTFAAFKAGFETLEAQRHLGEVVVGGIGVPGALLARFGRAAAGSLGETWRAEPGVDERPGAASGPGRVEAE